MTSRRILFPDSPPPLPRTLISKIDQVRSIGGGDSLANLNSTSPTRTNCTPSQLTHTKHRRRKRDKDCIYEEIKIRSKMESKIEKCGNYIPSRRSRKMQSSVLLNLPSFTKIDSNKETRKNSKKARKGKIMNAEKTRLKQDLRQNKENINPSLDEKKKNIGLINHGIHSNPLHFSSCEKNLRHDEGDAPISVSPVTPISHQMKDSITSEHLDDEDQSSFQSSLVEENDRDDCIRSPSIATHAEKRNNSKSTAKQIFENVQLSRNNTKCARGEMNHMFSYITTSEENQIVCTPAQSFDFKYGEEDCLIDTVVETKVVCVGSIEEGSLSRHPIDEKLHIKEEKLEPTDMVTSRNYCKSPKTRPSRILKPINRLVVGFKRRGKRRRCRSKYIACSIDESASQKEVEHGKKLRRSERNHQPVPRFTFELQRSNKDDKILLLNAEECTSSKEKYPKSGEVNCKIPFINGSKHTINGANRRYEIQRDAVKCIDNRLDCNESETIEGPLSEREIPQNVCRGQKGLSNRKENYADQKDSSTRRRDVQSMRVRETASNLEWSDLQIGSLKQAHFKARPTSSSFWQEIAISVPNKSAGDCRDKWFSMVGTPTDHRKKRANRVDSIYLSSSDDWIEDDIFNSTPIRNANMKKNSVRNPHAGSFEDICSSPILMNKKITTRTSVGSEHDIKEESSPFLICRQYKTYLKEVRAGINSKTSKLKSSIDTSRNISLSASFDQGDYQIEGNLTPGGTLNIVTPKEDFEDEESCIYDI